MTQRPVVEQLLPRPPSEEDEVKHYWEPKIISKKMVWMTGYK